MKKVGALAELAGVQSSAPRFGCTAIRLHRCELGEYADACLRQYFFDDFAMYVGESSFEAVVIEGEAFVIEAHEVQ